MSSLGWSTDNPHTRFVRGRTGNRFHKRGAKCAGSNVVSWNYAETYSDDQLRWQLAGQPDYVQPCGRCKPLGVDYPTLSVEVGDES